MATAAAPGEAAGGGSSVSSSVSSAPPAAVEAVAAEWMLEFACSCLCRHFAEQSGAEFWRWRDVAQGERGGAARGSRTAAPGAASPAGPEGQLPPARRTVGVLKHS